MNDVDEYDKNFVRQVNISCLNESVNLLSSDPKDSMNILCRKALRMLHHLRKNNEGRGK